MRTDCKRHQIENIKSVADPVLHFLMYEELLQPNKMRDMEAITNKYFFCIFFYSLQKLLARFNQPLQADLISIWFWLTLIGSWISMVLIVNKLNSPSLITTCYCNYKKRPQWSNPKMQSSKFCSFYHFYYIQRKCNE